MNSAPRISYLELGKIYFWTATINGWHHLLDDNRKEIIRQSLIELSHREVIDVFAYVIMPNHIHLIWRLNTLNGKELPSGSLLKFTAHAFKKSLSANELATYKVEAANKQYEFWKRDSMAIELYSPDVAWQKLDYLHDNPVVEKWGLVNDPCDYLYSSASFYLANGSDQGFLRHLGEEIG